MQSISTTCKQRFKNKQQVMQPTFVLQKYNKQVMSMLRGKKNLVARLEQKTKATFCQIDLQHMHENFIIAQICSIPEGF